MPYWKVSGGARGRPREIEKTGFRADPLAADLVMSWRCPALTFDAIMLYSRLEP